MKEKADLQPGAARVQAALVEAGLTSEVHVLPDSGADGLAR